MHKYAVQKHEHTYRETCLKHGIFSNSLESLLLCIHSPKNYNFYVCQNIFLREELKTVVTEMYCTLKTIQLVLQRYLYNRRYKKSCNDKDLSCIPFTEYKPQDYFELIDKSQKYLFKQSDMYNLIEASLTHTTLTMISNPVPIKNPYTGVPFNVNLLYIVFLKLKHVPPLFSYFMKCNFKLDDFLLNYECLLRTHTIHKTLKEFTKEKKREEIINMLSQITAYDYDDDTYIPIINPNHLKIDLLALEPLLLLFYNYQYSLNPYQRNVDYKRLIQRLLKLRENDIFIIIS